MSLRVNTNVEAFNAHRNLEGTQMKLSKSMQKLSSGLRINSAADDAAGLAISEKMRSQINGTAQAQRNAMDGISLVQTAEGAYNEMHSILQRVRELAVQAQNGTLSTSDKAAIDQEVGQLTAELTRIAGNTQFNGLQVLSGSFTLQVGADSGGGNQIGFSLTRAQLLEPSAAPPPPARSRRSTRRSRASRPPARPSARSRTGSRTPSPTSASTRRTSPPPSRASATSTSRRRRSTSPSCRSSRSPAPPCSPRRTRPRTTCSRCSRARRERRARAHPSTT